MAILNTHGAKERRVKTKDCIMTSTYCRPRDAGKGMSEEGPEELHPSGTKIIESKLSQS